MPDFLVFCGWCLSPPSVPACAAFALISDYVSNSDPGIRAGAILGLGLAYAGTQREEVQELLVPLVRWCWLAWGVMAAYAAPSAELAALALCGCQQFVVTRSANLVPAAN